MAHMTISIPDEMYEEIKDYTEVKWSEAARRGIIMKLQEVKGITSGKELLHSLPESTKKNLDKAKKFSRADSNKWVKKMREKGWKRVNY